jgi:molybdopterin converting factor small subunit
MQVPGFAQIIDVFSRRLMTSRIFEPPACRAGSGNQMKITLKGLGLLRDYLGHEPQEVELSDNSAIKDLLRWIEEHHGSRFPAYLWDFQKHQFRGPVVLVINDKMTLDPSAPLTEGTEVSVMYAVAGGRPFDF